MVTYAEFEANAQALVARVSAACQIASRDPSTVRILPVTKTHPVEAALHAARFGCPAVAENRVQEAEARWTGRREGLELRLIGPLQTNKAEAAAALFDVIESLDRDRLALALVAAAQRTGRLPRLLVQVNTGEEPQKAGVLPADADAFLDRVRGDLALPVEGLMCIPPVGEPAGPHFGLLARIAARNGLPVLSMGMSDDFETAIAFGATHVRVGSALFGARN
jgi:pyridoxal phosphate enzyme (YggS family)